LLAQSGHTQCDGGGKFFGCGRAHPILARAPIARAATLMYNCNDDDFIMVNSVSQAK
jgi:hypothetical protein